MRSAPPVTRMVAAIAALIATATVGTGALGQLLSAPTLSDRAPPAQQTRTCRGLLGCIEGALGSTGAGLVDATKQGAGPAEDASTGEDEDPSEDEEREAASGDDDGASDDEEVREMVLSPEDAPDLTVPPNAFPPSRPDPLDCLPGCADPPAKPDRFDSLPSPEIVIDTGDPATSVEIGVNPNLDNPLESEVTVRVGEEPPPSSADRAPPETRPLSDDVVEQFFD